MTMRDPIQELADKSDLNDLVYRTMRALDDCDWPGYRANLADNAEFDFTDHGASDKSAEILKGADPIITVLRSVMDGFDATQHIVTNVIHRIDGDTARTDCNVVAEHFLNNDIGDRSVTCGGRFEIASRREAQGWKIATLRFVTAWFRGNTTLYKLAAEAVAARAPSSGN